MIWGFNCDDLESTQISWPKLACSPWLNVLDPAVWSDGNRSDIASYYQFDP